MREIRRVEVPQEFSPAILSDNTVIVIIDVYMFSSTIITLHSQGVEEVIPVYTPEELEEYREMGLLVGGDSQSEFDFSNSPQNVYAEFGVMETVPETVAMTSNNGAQRSVEAIEAIENENLENCAVLIGTSMNAKAVSEYIQEKYSDHNVLLLCAGSQGEATIEDVIGSLAISQSLRDETLPIVEYEEILSLLPSGRIKNETSYSWLSEEDVTHISNINKFDIVSEYDFQNGVFRSC